jgi:glycosyltransferase involved in cell wall biosynthesis
MEVALTSIVRNGMGYIDRYAHQVGELARLLYENGEHDLDVYIAEGDSTDGTWEWLQGWAAKNPHEYGVTAIKADHGGPVFGSVDNPTRWQNIARTYNRAFQVTGLHRPDAVIQVESDLIWHPETMRSLLAHLEQVPAVAPMSMHQRGFFWDIWGHRGMDGDHFTNQPPYYWGLVDLPLGKLMQISSAGSCIVMRGEIAGRCWFDEADAMLGKDIYAKGYSLWLDPSLSVTHP